MEENTTNRHPASTPAEPGKKNVVSPLLSLPDRDAETSKLISISGISTGPTKAIRNTGDDLPPISTLPKQTGKHLLSSEQKQTGKHLLSAAQKQTEEHLLDPTLRQSNEQRTTSSQRPPDVQRSASPERMPDMQRPTSSQRPHDVQRPTSPERMPDMQRSSSPQRPPDVQRPTSSQRPPDVQRSASPQRPPDVQRSSSPQRPPDVQRPTSPQRMPDVQRSSSQRMPDVQRSPQRDASEQQKLVRLISRTEWEERFPELSTKYPEELVELINTQTLELHLEMMNAETQLLQAVTPDTPTPAGQTQKKKKKIRRKMRRVPEMRQVTAVECGAACLAMALNYYGYATSISEVQEHCGVGRDGLTAFEIVRSARQYNLRVRAVSLKQNDFRYVTLPAIIHWEFNHFMIVERWSEKWVDVIDPAMGRRRLTTEEFDEGFTGVIIMVEPGPQFAQKSAQKSLSLWSYMRSLLQARNVLIQIIGASLLLQVLGLGIPLLTEVIIDHVIPMKANDMLQLLVLGMAVLTLMQGVTSFLRSSLLIYLQTSLDTRMMLNFFEHLLSLPYRFFQMRMNGDLLARVNSNSAIRDLITNQFISTILDGSTVIVYLIILLSLSKFLALLALGIGGFQVVLLLGSAPFMRRLTQQDLEAQGKTQGYLNEALSGIATLKAAGAEHRALGRWQNLFFDEMNISLRLSYFSSIVGTLMSIISGLTPLLFLWVGSIQVIDGKLSVGAMLALNTLALSFLGPLTSLAGIGQSLQIVRAHFSRIADVISAQPEQDPSEVRTPHKLSGNIELRHVGFQYDPNAPMILQDISITVQRGQKVALVGKTGSGKSTLGKLLVGLIPPTKGSILFDGVPLDSLNFREVRNQFGVVLQEAFIFSGSVKENIALNNPDMNMPQIMQAAQLAAIDEDIKKMPMGYDTLVSEGGSAFSGGQRQRLALSRALAHHPAILLLDEATSALDVATERTVEQNLNRLPCTQVVIAHRLSTIRNADVILVLDQGHIVERGSHEQLLRAKGFYAKLIQMQLQNGEVAMA